MIYPELLASDIEAKGFYERVNAPEDVHCLCSIDVRTDEVYLFHNYPEYDNMEVWDEYDQKSYKIPARKGTLQEGIEFWVNAASSGSKLIVHNCQTYDRPILEKVFPDQLIPEKAWHDTFVQSKLQWFERPTPKGAKSAHGLKAFGIRCGINKPEITDWEEMDAYKLMRVVEDVRIQKQTYLMLEKEKELIAKLGVNMAQAFSVERLYAYECCSKQEIVGAKVDLKHIDNCLKDLDGKIDQLAKEIEPHLPPTVKPASGKVSRKEMAALMGFNPDRVNDTYVQRNVNGNTEVVVEKPYVKPTTNYTKVVKTASYSGFHISYGDSPSFEKKAELSAWIKENHPDTKPKEWGIEKEEREKVVINAVNCKYFDIEEDSGLIGGPFTKVSFEPSKMTQSDVVKGYLIRLGWKDAEDWNIKKDSEGGFVKAEVDTVVRWPPKASPENQLVRKVKKGELLVTSPKLSEDDYAQLPDGIGKKIAEYNTYQHRRRFLSNPKDPENKGLLSYVREDGRIPCGLGNFMTATGRSNQRVWVNAPGEKSLYGNEIRATIIADKGKVLIGADQKSSQLSIAAFFAKNWDYYQAVASGEEFKLDENGDKVIHPVSGEPWYIGESAHCYSARNFGIVSMEDWEKAKEFQDQALIHDIHIKRGFSKGASFGVIFGCSGKKLAGMLKIPEKEGNEKKDTFLAQMGLDAVKDFLMECKKKYPYKGGFYIPLSFGYWVWCKQDHKAINYLIQGTEAIMQKMAGLRTAKELQRKGYSDKCVKILDVHDEQLYECHSDVAKECGSIIANGYTWAADMLYNYYIKNSEYFPNKGVPTFKIDLSGGFEVGQSYAECH